MKFAIKDFFSKCDQIRSSLGICSHLLKKYLIESFIYFAWSVKIPNLHVNGYMLYENNTKH